MKNQNKDIPQIPLDGLSKLRELSKKRDSGEDLDPTTKDALDAISIASKIMNTIMNGSQVDPVFIKHIALEYKKKFTTEPVRKIKIIKKKKLKLRPK